MAEPDIRLVTGLGNPGKEYEATRHNAGFMVIDRLRDALPGAFAGVDRGASRCWRGRCRGRILWLQQPLAYMNCSGEPVAALMRREGIVPAEVLLVYDDLDLPLGRIRLRRGGGSGGHRGVASVIEVLGGDGFGRLRIGIGRGGRDTVEHVLSPFTQEEEGVFGEVLTAAVDAVKIALHRDLSVAMNEYNGSRFGGQEERSEQDNPTEE
jgi:PTH1 family peptidyl-tRNA hydrolase